ncbi:DUF1127 domain-containing protein [Falsiphaeobacter marinintestinus]|uniref:DUF1127 domain-containing protein n=1 Tax=Falsiphaeobacter marinintestinus TaxID=1492905 RepID=UPI0011B6EE6C|nr:DUF1127 domain-containing protein [Phaeobacter marinintestinus]
MAASTHITAHHGSVFDRLQAAIDGYKVSFARYRTFRNTLNEMSLLSNRELADLGLHRSELRRVAHQAAYEAN